MMMPLLSSFEQTKRNRSERDGIQRNGTPHLCVDLVLFAWSVRYCCTASASMMPLLCSFKETQRNGTDRNSAKRNLAPVRGFCAVGVVSQVLLHSEREHDAATALLQRN